MVHGRSWKPPQAPLRRLWIDALRHGLERDHSPRIVDLFNNATKELVYYGDVSNALLRTKLGQKPADDLADRRLCLAALKQYAADEFTRRAYRQLPGATSIKEFAADLFGPILSTFRLSEIIINEVAPDIREYWNPDSSFGSRVRQPMIGPLKRAMRRGDRILVIAHSMGTLVAWDTLWKFSWTAEYRPAFCDENVHLLLTMGSPLGDETVKRNLKGAAATGPRRYPRNIVRWVNVSAEDDYICHDQRIRNDYRRMRRFKMVHSIEDRRIYNLAVRHGRSNPHSSPGYLVHPEVARLVADFCAGR